MSCIELNNDGAIGLGARGCSYGSIMPIQANNIKVSKADNYNMDVFYSIYS